MKTLNIIDNSKIYKKILEEFFVAKPPSPKPSYAPGIEIVVAVSGAATLGKTTFCNGLKECLEKSGYSTSHIQLDGYLKSREEREKIKNYYDPSKKLSGYDPRATDFEKLLEDISQLIFSGKETLTPIYNHSTGKSDSNILVAPKKIIILDGIASLHYEIRDKLPNFGIFLYSDELTMKGLRLKVDMQERGYSVFEALNHSIDEFNAYNRWIHHHYDLADLRLFVDKDRKITIEQ